MRGILLIFGLATEGLLLPLAFRAGAGWPVLAAAHFAGCFLCLPAFLGKNFLRQPSPDGFAAMLFLFFFSTAALPVILLFFMLLRMRGRFRAGICEDYESYVGERESRFSEVEGQDHALRKLREEISFEPLADIMRGEDLAIKARAIERLSRSVTIDHVRLLRLAVKDEAPEIRMIAAGALMKLEAGMEEKIRALTRTAKSQGSAAVFADLGDLYRTYVESGLAETRLRQHYLEKSAEAYEQALFASPDRREIVIRYCRALLKIGKFDEARAAIDDAVSLWAEDTELLFIRNEIYFNLGRYSDLKDHFARMPLIDMDLERRRVVDFWMQAE